MLKYHWVLLKPHVLFFLSSTSKHHCDVEGKNIFLESSYVTHSTTIYEKVNLTLADHLISLAEAKPRKVGKSTYKSMNELLNAIKESGYNPEEDSPVAKVSTSNQAIEKKSNETEKYFVN